MQHTQNRSRDQRPAQRSLRPARPRTARPPDPPGYTQGANPGGGLPGRGVSGTARPSAGTVRGWLAPTPAAQLTTPLTRKSRSSVHPGASAPEERCPAPAPAASMFISLRYCVPHRLGPGGVRARRRRKVPLSPLYHLNTCPGDGRCPQTLTFRCRAGKMW